jgi:hypothetical protein
LEGGDFPFVGWVQLEVGVCAAEKGLLPLL